MTVFEWIAGAAAVVVIVQLALIYERLGAIEKIGEHFRYTPGQK